MKGLEAKTLGLKKVIRHEYKRIVAFMLTVAMVVTNFGTNLTVAFAAGEETSSLFLLDSSELEDAISTALESGDVFDFSSLELKAKQKSLKTSYEKLIGSKAGKVYQLDVDIDSSYATEHTDLQVFYNAGTDDVVFLFINESDMAVTFRANVSGYETARVTVNPNTTNIEDAEGVENAEDYSGTTMVDDEKKPQAEVVKPEGETSETVENGSDETEEETKADVTESENASENGETEEKVKKATKKATTKKSTAKKTLPWMTKTTNKFKKLKDEAVQELTAKQQEQYAKALAKYEAEKAAEKAKKAGALGGKVLGAGGGGFILFYAELDKQAAVRYALNDLLYVPFRFEEQGASVIYYVPETYVPQGEKRVIEDDVWYDDYSNKWEKAEIHH